jgi:hypothetical protein
VRYRARADDSYSHDISPFSGMGTNFMFDPNH